MVRLNMSNKLENMIIDAKVTTEVITDALDECFGYDCEPPTVYTSALQTVLLRMLQHTNDKQKAIETATFCITAASLMDELDESTIH